MQSDSDATGRVASPNCCKYDIHLAALFLDVVFLCVRPDRPKECVLVAWGFTEDGERVLLSVILGMRESHEDWLELGRDLIGPRARRADA